MINNQAPLAARVRSHLAKLYPNEDLDALSARVLSTMGLELAAPSPANEPSPASEPSPANEPWSQNDIVLIAYANTITTPGETPLHTLQHEVGNLFGDEISILHLLPFYPASSDGGFAVVDHAAVAEQLGNWIDIAAVADRFKLMVDLVCGHVSRQHRWVHEFAADPTSDPQCLMTASPDDDLSLVVRPRTHPLLQPIDTAAGERHLWCTFSPDQVDIDYHQPEALLELLRILRTLLDHGARWVRLDAIAYLWKELGTPCIHLPETHEVVRLLRLLLDANGDQAVLITETNVDHQQNVSYFGDGKNESNVVYNFTLAPLLVHTFLHGSAATLQNWVGQNWVSSHVTETNTTFLNFIASHDGIGVRPVEKILSVAEINQLVKATNEAGGTHSLYETPDAAKPYELNVALFDLFISASNQLSVAHYLAAHAIMLSLAGVPSFYMHSLLCTPGRTLTEPDQQALSPRAINRQKLLTSELDEQLDADGGLRRSVMAELLRLIRIRRGESAFHPNSAQVSLPVNDAVFGLVRGGDYRGGNQVDGQPGGQVVCLTNVTNEPAEVDLGSLGAGLALAEPTDKACFDLLAQQTLPLSEPLALQPGQTVWLKPG